MGTLVRGYYFNYYFKRYIPREKIRSALDAACGRGQHSRKLAEWMPHASVKGIDIEATPEWKDKTFKNLSYEQKDLTYFNERDAFDLIVSVDTLEHIPNNQTIMQKFYDALHVGGFFYLAVPCEATETHIFPAKMFEKFREWEEHEHIGEQRTKAELETILSRIGFEIIFSRYTFTFWGVLAWETEFLLRGKKWGDRVNVIFMPLYKMLAWLDIYFPIGKGNNLIIGRKK